MTTKTIRRIPKQLKAAERQSTDSMTDHRELGTSARTVGSDYCRLSAFKLLALSATPSFSTRPSNKHRSPNSRGNCWNNYSHKKGTKQQPWTVPLLLRQFKAAVIKCLMSFRHFAQKFIPHYLHHVSGLAMLSLRYPRKVISPWWQTTEAFLSCPLPQRGTLRSC